MKKHITSLMLGLSLLGSTFYSARPANADLAFHTLRYRQSLLLKWPNNKADEVPTRFEITINGSNQETLLHQIVDGKSTIDGVVIDIKNIPTGEYHLTVTSVSASDEKQTVIDRPWQYTVPDRSTYDINRDNVLLDGGTKFFPLGIYHVRTPDFATVAKHGFNIISADAKDDVYHFQQDKYIKAAADNGLKVLLRGYGGLDPHLPEPIVWAKTEAYRNDDTALAWYLDDEPAVTEKSLERFTKRYEHITRVDNTKPVFLADNKPDKFHQLAPFTDIIAPDPYTFNIEPNEKVAEWTKRARQSVADEKPVWTILQMYTFTAAKEGAPTWNDLPTAAKLRMESYLALAAGARGLLYYAFDDTYYRTDTLRGTHLANEYPQFWKSYKPVIQELKKLQYLWTAPYASHGVTNLSNDSDADAVVISEKPYSYSGNYWVLAVNPSKNQTKEIRFAVDNCQLNKAVEIFSQSAVTLENNNVIDTLPPHGVRLYQLFVK